MLRGSVGYEMRKPNAPAQPSYERERGKSTKHSSARCLLLHGLTLLLYPHSRLIQSGAPALLLASRISLISDPVYIIPANRAEEDKVW